MGLITDGRFSGGTWGMVVGHVAPEAYAGGTIALVQEGDSITIDAHTLSLNLNVGEAEIARAPRGVDGAEAPLHPGRAGQVCEERVECEHRRGARPVITNACPPLLRKAAGGSAAAARLLVHAQGFEVGLASLPLALFHLLDLAALVQARLVGIRPPQHRAGKRP